MTRSGLPARGFSLLELLVAMAVLGLSLTLLYRVDAGVLRGVADQAQHERATALAQSLLDAREAVPASGWAEQGQGGGLSWAVSSHPLPLPPGLKPTAPLLHEVRIAVHWQGGSGPRQLELATLLPQAQPRAGDGLP
jgi:general secretion pathway protein I